MGNREISIRSADVNDLAAVNRIIEMSVMSWDLPERVKRLAMPSYRYSEMDLEFLEIAVATDADGNILGVSAWEMADTTLLPPGTSGLLLHGLYVDQQNRQQGTGRRLVDHVAAMARQQSLDGIVVKAQQDANAFYHAIGMQPLEDDDDPSQHANRFWLPVT